jgi:hypothetical protein
MQEFTTDDLHFFLPAVRRALAPTAPPLPLKLRFRHSSLQILLKERRAPSMWGFTGADFGLWFAP